MKLRIKKSDIKELVRDMLREQLEVQPVLVIEFLMKGMLRGESADDFYREPDGSVSGGSWTEYNNVFQTGKTYVVWAEEVESQYTPGTMYEDLEGGEEGAQRQHPVAVRIEITNAEEEYDEYEEGPYSYSSGVDVTGFAEGKMYFYEEYLRHQIEMTGESKDDLINDILKGDASEILALFWKDDFEFEYLNRVQ